jgi:thiol-disulfide isomerase/thioredoxin
LWACTQSAPDFTVPTLDGGSFSLSSHLADDGRPVLVNMWAEWCFPCRAEMPAIDAASEAHPGIHFIGVVVRDREAPARKFVEEYGISYQIGLDTNGAVERDYLVWVMPSTYLIGADGLVIERFFGPMNEAQLDELLAGAASTDI